jgi:hypothetical protein
MHHFFIFWIAMLCNPYVYPKPNVPTAEGDDDEPAMRPGQVDYG